MASRKICILGGTGFVGRHLANELYRRGDQVLVLTASRERHRELLIVPSLTLREVDVFDTPALEQAIAGQDVVINLIGILNERGHDGSGFKRVHTDLARQVAESCRKQGVPRLLHMSALGADPGRAPSYYLRSKGEGESQVMMQARPDVAVTIFRPSVIFGPGDSFINRFAGLLRLVPLAFPLACHQSRYAPVYVGDVVRGFADSIDDPDTYGQRYDLCGPHIYTLKEIVEFTARTAGLRRRIIGLNDFFSRLQAGIMEFLPGKPLSLDNYHSARVGNICGERNGLDFFGIEPTPMEAVVPTYVGERTARDQYPGYRREARSGRHG